MCTPEQIREIVHAELAKQRDDFVRKFWYIIISMIVASVGAWYSLYYQVQNLEIRGRAEEIAVQKQIDVLREDYKGDLAEIKTDLRFIREQITR